MNSDPFRIDMFAESQINATDDRAIRDGLVEAFPAPPASSFFASRRWWRRQPAFRWLTRTVSGEIIAHLAVHDLKVLSSAGPLAVLGISEVYTRPTYRGRGLVRQLFSRLHTHGHNRPWSTLFGQPHVYRSSGYLPTGSPLIIEGRPPEILTNFLVRPLVADVAWPSEPIDIDGPGW